MADLKKIIDKNHAYAQFMADEITDICTLHPDRSAGSESEVAVAERFADTLQNQCGCEVAVDKFESRPQALTGWVYFSITCFVLGIISFFFIPLLGILLHTFGIVSMALQYVFRINGFDKLYLPAESVNVTGFRKCSGEVQGRIIFNGNLDADWHHPFNTKIGGKGHAILIVLSLAGALISLALCIGATVVSKCYAGVSSPTIYGAGIFYAGVAMVAFIPVMILTYYAVDEKKVTSGANALTGATLSVAIMKALQDENIDLENVEVGVFLTGSKYAGHRGAKALSQKHRDDFYDVPTLLYTFDNIRSAKDLQVCYNDVFGFVKGNEFIADLMMDSADAVEVNMTENKIMPTMGATDAGTFRMNKFMSVAVTGVNAMDDKCCGTLMDTLDTLDKQALADCFKVAVKCIEKTAEILKEEDDDHHHCDDPDCHCHHHHEE
ncbi:MAG: hypothetical protein IKA59_01650 [Clostridia bacterium]|nr:hypothetical protein [Clostridia bacterium]